MKEGFFTRHRRLLSESFDEAIQEAERRVEQEATQLATEPTSPLMTDDYRFRIVSAVRDVEETKLWVTIPLTYLRKVRASQLEHYE